ncbi:ABC transporter permease [Streptococcus himalayensis]|uniref:Peptide ABC transporter permease n=1 Tax=Streptococcus himalayensis TaxID=1888195 RepID=A0A917A7I1_9STRE|nr:ABC transporter permease [Streptococcus himalayensis]GGE31930.1 peptide ABC transporter permease [Streptococcus himalayensis]
MIKLTSKLAVSNLFKNRRLYYPFALASCLAVALSYLFISLTLNPHLEKVAGASSIAFALGLGIVVVSIAEVIIVLYANSFVMKNRSKELGVYGMLGMTKWHLFLMTVQELIFFGIGTFVLGLGIGLLFDKLIYAFLLKLMKVKVELISSFQWPVLVIVLIIYMLIFALLILINGWRLVRFNPLQLSKETASGEKKGRFLGLQAFLGGISLALGYFLALSVKDPVAAIMTFFLAVLAVILGTYLLFNAGITLFLAFLKKRKHYYYQPNNMISVSNLIYRMKKNAVGLATISILSTMVLVTLTAGINIYAGSDFYQKVMNPRDFAVAGQGADPALVTEALRDFAKEHELTMTKQDVYESYVLGVRSQEGNQFDVFHKTEVNVLPQAILLLFSAADYEKMTGEELTLKENEAAVYSKNIQLDSSKPIRFANQNLEIKERLKDNFIVGNIPDQYSVLVSKIVYLVVNDPSQVLSPVRETARVNQELYGGFNTDASRESQLALTAAYEEKIDQISQGLAEGYLYGSVKADAVEQMNGLIGGIFFIGIFLSFVFMLGTVLVIYYKQISEGFEDRDRFVILQKVGLDEGQIKQTIRKQVLTVFFLPLIFAFVHLAFAYHIISLILQVLGVLNSSLMLMVTLGICGLFFLLYLFVFLITSKSYHKIVAL